MNLFITIRVLDILDIFLVAYLLLFIYNLIKGTVAINIFVGILAIYFVWRIIQAYEMEMLGGLLGQFFSVGVIALIIVFQQEIRHFLFLFGKARVFQNGFKMRNVLLGRWQISDEFQLSTPKLITAISNMSKSKTGALIVITRKNELNTYVDTGEFISAKISTLLIESIFYKNSPLHDGAIIIIKNKIRAARCVLPINDTADFPDDLGLRHRAAAAITEDTDAISIIVSEQTGQISIAQNGILYRKLTPEDVKLKLEEIFVTRTI